MKWYAKALITAAVIEGVSLILIPISIAFDSIQGLVCFMFLNYPGFLVCLALGMDEPTFAAIIPSFFIWILLSMLFFGIVHRLVNNNKK